MVEGLVLSSVVGANPTTIRQMGSLWLQMTTLVTLIYGVTIVTMAGGLFSWATTPQGDDGDQCDAGAGGDCDSHGHDC